MDHSLQTIIKISHTISADHTYSVTICVATDSMMPLIKPKEKSDFLLCKTTPKIGDIVLMKFNDRLYCHRVIGRIHEYYLTKGDNCIWHDIKSIHKNEIYGFLVISGFKKQLQNLFQKIKLLGYICCPIVLLYHLKSRLK